jgi:hypothetical protein
MTKLKEMIEILDKNKELELNLIELERNLNKDKIIEIINKNEITNTSVNQWIEEDIFYINIGFKRSSGI